MTNRKGFSLIMVLTMLMAFSGLTLTILGLQSYFERQSIRSLSTLTVENEAQRLAEAMRLATYEVWLDNRVNNTAWSAGDESRILALIPSLAPGWTVVGNTLTFNPATFAAGLPVGTLPGGMSANNIVPPMTATASITPPSGTALISSRQPSVALPGNVGFFSALPAYFDSIPYTLNVQVSLLGAVTTYNYAGNVVLAEIPPSTMALSASGAMQLNDLSGNIAGTVAAGQITGGAGVNFTGKMMAENVQNFAGSVQGVNGATLAGGSGNFNLRGASEAGVGVAADVVDRSVSRAATLGYAISPIHLVREGLGNSAEVPVAKQPLYRKFQPYYNVPVANRLLFNVTTPVNTVTPLVSLATFSGDGGSAGAVPGWITFCALPRVSAPGGNAVVAMVDVNSVPVDADGVARAFIGGYRTGTSTDAFTVMLRSQPSVTPVQVEIITPNLLVFSGTFNTTVPIRNVKVYAGEVAYGWSGTRPVTMSGTITGVSTNQAVIGFRTVSGDTPSSLAFTPSTTTATTKSGEYLAAFVQISPQ